MKNNKSFFGLLLVILVLLPGCYHVPSYQRKPLRRVSADFTHCAVENNVIVQAKQLTDPETQHLFGSRGETLKNQCKIIYLSVHNMSSSAYVFSPADIDLTIMSHQDVARLMKTNSINGIARIAVSAGGAAASYYLTMLCVLAGKGGDLEVLPIIAAGSVGLGVISIGAGLMFLGKTFKSMIMNGRMNKDLKEKIISKKVIINPGQYCDGLIFVKSSDYKPQFTVTMHEKDSFDKRITFDVDLRQNEQ